MRCPRSLLIAATALSCAIIVPTVSWGVTLLRHYKLDDNAADNLVVDSTGTANAGYYSGFSSPNSNTPVNTNTVSTTGQIGTGLSFSPASPSTLTHVRLDSNADMNFSGAFAIAGWVRTSDTTAGVATMRRSTSGNPVLSLMLGDDGAGNFGNGEIGALTRNDASGNLRRSDSNTLINDGSYHHVALVRTTGDELRLLVDGAIKDTDAGAGGTMTTDLRALGAELRWVQDNFRSFNDRFLIGDLDDVGYWGGELTDGEVNAIYNLALTLGQDGSAFDFNYDLGQVQQMLLVHDALSGQTTIGYDVWAFADGLNALAGGAAEGDLFVSGGDTFLLLSSSGTGTGLQRVAVIPEPSTLAIWGLGLIGLIGWRRRRRTK